MMTKTKLLGAAVVFLSLLNLAQWIWLRPSPPAPPREIIINSLHLDEAQISDYEPLIQAHRQKILACQDSLQQYKNALYTSLKDTPSLDQVQQQIKAIAQIHEQMEQAHFEHFAGIKKLCRQEQLSDFYALTDRFARLFAPRPRR